MELFTIARTKKITNRPILIPNAQQNTIIHAANVTLAMTDLIVTKLRKITQMLYTAPMNPTTVPFTQKMNFSQNITLKIEFAIFHF